MRRFLRPTTTRFTAAAPTAAAAAAAAAATAAATAATTTQLRFSSNKSAATSSQHHLTAAPRFLQQRRFQSFGTTTGTGGGGGGGGGGSFIDADDDELEKELKQQAAEFAAASGRKVGTTASPTGVATGEGAAASSSTAKEAVEINIVRVDRPPVKYEINTTTGVYKWATTAKYARRVVGPMREWADEFQCRTGVCVQMDAVDSDRAAAGGYASADDVDVNLYLFGSERAVNESVHFLRAMVATEPSYVRCALFRRAAASSESADSSGAGGEIEWLTLRRVNPELRPADIPPISLKTPGKYTLLFESPEEAVVRTVFEETGIEIDRKRIAKTHVFDKAPVAFYWRPRVDYWVAEVPRDAEVLGPQANTQRYVLHWDPRLLRQSADPIDRTWAAAADPKTGCAWLASKVVDSLQAPVKLETNYMATRYTPAPDTKYADVIKF